MVHNTVFDTVEDCNNSRAASTASLVLTVFHPPHKQSYEKGNITLKAGAFKHIFTSYICHIISSIKCPKNQRAWEENFAISN